MLANEPQTEPKADCYSAGEREAMAWTQQLRAWFFGPLLRFLAWIGIGPDLVTLASLLVGLAYCPLWLWPENPDWARPAALLALLFHVLLDGIDGPLARHLGVASRRGSFTDSLADQVVVTASTLALMAGPEPKLSIWVGGAYIFCYTMVVAFAMVRNALGVPYSWLIRPRFWVYAWMAVDLFWLPGWLDVVVGVLAAGLAIKMITGFIALRRLL